MTPRLAVVALLALALAGCSSSDAPPGVASTPAPKSSSAAPIALVGRLTLGGISTKVQGSPCHEIGRGYDDIHPGAEVVISDDTGHTLAITNLGPGHVGDSYRCEFKFTARVAAGKHFYGVEVTHRGVVKFSESQLGDVALTLH